MRRGDWIGFDQPFFWDAQKSGRMSKGPTIEVRLREEKEAVCGGWAQGPLSLFQLNT